jgi:uncharacterized protein YndB with AHSA1/START domain
MTEAIRQGDIPGVQLRRRQVLALPLEEAWRWLTEPAKLALWLANEAEVQLGPGGSLVLRGAGGHERGRTLEMIPPRRWAMAFERLDAGWPAATHLEINLHPVSGGCEVDVLQNGFQRLPLSTGLTVWESYRLRWRTALARLAEVASAPIPPAA